MAKLGVYQIAFLGHVGVTEEEQNTPQPLQVDIELTGAIDTASDQLEGTVDYDALCRKILEIGRQSRVQLIETLADRMADVGLEDHRIHSVCVRVTKCHPPLKEIEGGFVVQIRRARQRSGQGVL